MRILSLWLLLIGWTLSAQSLAPDPAGENTVRVDVNQATARDFEAIRGVGPVTARLIVGSRTQLGGFRAFEEIYAVPKLSRTIVERIREQMDFRPPQQQAQVPAAGRSDSK